MDEQLRHDEGRKSGKKGKSALGLTIIGIGKLIKVTVLLTLGVSALLAVNHRAPDMLMDVANFVGVDPDSRHLHRLVAGVAGVSPKKLEEVGFGCFVYAALFATEAVGLLMQKRWGEYFTMAITISFLPLEVYEIVHHDSVAKIVTLVLNVIVAVYLIVRVRRERREGDEGKAAGARDRRREPARLGIASH